MKGATGKGLLILMIGSGVLMPVAGLSMLLALGIDTLAVKWRGLRAAKA